MAPSEIALKPSVKKSILGVSAFVIVGTLFTALTFMSNDPHLIAKRPLILKFYIPASIFALAFELHKVYKRKPTVIINDKFIWWSQTRSGSPAEEIVFWSDIDHFEINWTLQNFDGVDIHTINPEKYLSESKLVKQEQARLLKKNGTFLSISTHDLDIDSDELIRILKEYQEKLRDSNEKSEKQKRR